MRIREDMALAQPDYSRTQDLSRFQSVPVTLSGRYMLESRREYACQTMDMSPGAMTLIAPVAAKLGEKVIVYLEHIGRFAGVVVGQTGSGFSLEMNLSPAKRDRLADQLTWFANRNAISLPEDRRHDRIIPLLQRTLVRLPNGQEIFVKIRDLSLSGVGLETEVRPKTGAHILVGATPAVVVRHFDGGIGVEFEKPFSPGQIDESTRL